jgi:hypothetical protein
MSDMEAYTGKVVYGVDDGLGVRCARAEADPLRDRLARWTPNEPRASKTIATGKRNEQIDGVLRIVDRIVKVHSGSGRWSLPLDQLRFPAQL